MSDKQALRQPPGLAQPLRLENRYTILMDDEEYFPLCDNPPLPCPRATHPGPSTQLVPPRSPPPLNSTTSTLVISSSVVRDLYIPPSPSGPSKVYCFPCAKVCDIQHKLPSILTCHANVNNIIVHLGTNEIRERRSVALQENYKTLITNLMGTGKCIVISGPLPNYRKGAERWSILFDLHTWLKHYCASLASLNNFDLFWERPSLLKDDGLHPN
ncbi:hypothetical protein UPYG_G00023880 [Umbra pygmaea]|uniref:SGNH hydrolase-type esterase domain-containing protein n=1 Tax=Umbra pygmaea TaxID=75934 RepID=A0ABD0YAF3_UMBPY